MKKDRIIELKIDKMCFPNIGVGNHEEKTMKVMGALPGQTVTAMIKGTRKRAVARIMEVLTPSPIEIEAACPEFGICGGCCFQNIGYGDECELKEKMVLELFENASISGFDYKGFVPAPSCSEYRNKLELSFGDEEKGGKLTLGMKKKDSYYETANGSNCDIADADFRKITGAVLEFFRSLNEKFFHRRRKEGTLRYLMIRKGFYTGEILVNLITTSEFSIDLDNFVIMLKNLVLDGVLKGVIHTECNNPSDVIKPEVVRILYGSDFISDVLLGLRFNISVFSFFQTNSAGASLLYITVREFAGDCRNKTIFDLYCGTGTIAQILSHGTKEVIGIELNESAVIAARQNAAINNITNCKFIAGDVLKEVDELVEKPDLIIVDPPREGIHPKALQKIIAFQSPEIIYVSCKPTSLVVDLKEFIQSGYTIKIIKIHDMFPRTSHVESVVLMSRVEK